MSSKKAKEQIKSLQELGETLGLEANVNVTETLNEVTEEEIEKEIKPVTEKPSKKVSSKDNSKLVLLSDHVKTKSDSEAKAVTSELIEEIKEEIKEEETTEVQEIEVMPLPVVDGVELKEELTKIFEDSIGVDTITNSLQVSVETPINEQLGEDDREAIISDLRKMYSLVKVPYLEQSWNKLSNVELLDLLYMLKAENGGSIEVATLIKETEDEFKSALNSDFTKSRMKLIEQKGSDHAKMIQILEKQFGSDFVVNSTRSKEYHQMLKSAVVYISTLTQKINKLATKLGMTIPENEFLPTKNLVPIIEDTPADPRVSMYVLNALDAQLDKFFIQGNHMNEIHTRHVSRITQLEKQEKIQNETVKGYKEKVDDIIKDTQRLLGNNSGWIIQEGNKILRKINPEKALSHVNDLDLRGHIDDALIFTTERAAENMAERLVKTRRFKGRHLEVYRLSVVKV